MQFFQTTCKFILLWSKYSLQHPVLKHPQSMFLSLCQTVLQPYRITGKTIVSYILIFMFSTRYGKTEGSGLSSSTRYQSSISF
jgi:hypothetical protein